MNLPFPEIKNKLGFGCMRLQMQGDMVDYAEFSKMIDTFIGNGFNYFDTAHGYIDKKSETAIRDCLSKRYPRESFLLANKLSEGFFEKEEDIIPLFEMQLERCGIEYFDFYLMHALGKNSYEKYKACRAFEAVGELKKAGKVKHIGMSFHDRADVLDKILTEQPSVEFVQLQFNYLDYDDKGVQSFKCYEVCKKHNKPVIVMEPVKGGTLVNLPTEAKTVLDSLKGGSYASYAIRFAASFDNNILVLSGMGNMEMMNDNISYMKEFKPLEEKEYTALEKVREILKKQDIIPCTACRYCEAGCPKNIPIPDLFAKYNAEKQNGTFNAEAFASDEESNGGKASVCIRCGKCEQICPQKLEIRKLLEKLA